MVFLNFSPERGIMYEIFQKLLNEKGVKTSDVARATGISNMTFSDWKRGKCVPKIDKLQKIADYFGVTVEYIMTGQLINAMRIPPLLYFLILYHILWKYPHNTPLSAIIINSNIFIHRKNQVHKVLGHLLKSVATIQPGYNFP